MKSKAAIIGGGLIGASWAAVFARAGYTVAIYDQSKRVRSQVLNSVVSLLTDQCRARKTEIDSGLASRVTVVDKLHDAVDGVDYIQESVAETRDAKASVIALIDQAAQSRAIIGSSSSQIPGSEFMNVPGRERCIVAHPVNPPHLIPLVELVPTQWTSKDVVERCQKLLTEAGQSPVLLHKEIQGFILNRLQSAVINEAMFLAKSGVADPLDIDKTISEGLGLRWCFLGPFETMDLNAVGGFADYANRYRKSYEDTGAVLGVREPWDRATIERIEGALRSRTSVDKLNERGQWRNDVLAKLADFKKKNGA